MKIAYIADVFGRVQHARYKQLVKLLPEHQFSFFYLSFKGSRGKIRHNLNSFDIIYYASLSLYNVFPLKHSRIYGSATSWKCVDSELKETQKILKHMTKVSANNVGLVEALQKIRKDVFHCPHGVDETVFEYSEQKKFDPKNIIIGWVGNVDRAEKQYGKVLRPLVKACRKIGINIRIIGTFKADKAKKLLSPKKVKQFYHELDFYLVTSKREGTPNTALEAAACGVPIITTKVGNMPQLIQHGVNGFFAKGTRDGILSVLKQIRRLSPENHLAMKQAIHSSILSDWTWSKRIENFRNFFS